MDDSVIESIGTLEKFLTEFDREYLKKAREAEKKGLKQKYWYGARPLHRKAQIYYSMCEKKQGVLTLGHGRRIQRQKFDKMTNLELIDRFYFLEDIFRDSEEDLLNLANSIIYSSPENEELPTGFRLAKNGVFELLEGARRIYIEFRRITEVKDLINRVYLNFIDYAGSNSIETLESPRDNFILDSLENLRNLKN